jgi:CRP-like cAMP-binding protein
MWVSTMCAKNGTDTIVAKMNHVQLARFLCISRTTLISELKKLSEDGTIIQEGSRYTLTKQDVGKYLPKNETASIKMSTCKNDLPLPIQILRQTKLFDDLNDEEIYNFFAHAPSKIVTYESEEIIIKPGDIIDRVGIIIDGIVTADTEILGEDEIETRSFEQNSIVGFAIATSLKRTSIWRLRAEQPCEILWIAWSYFSNPENYSIDGTLKILINTIKSYSNVDIKQDIRNNILSQRTAKMKILVWLGTMCEKHGSDTYTSKMNQVELARYLCMSRQQLITELNRLQTEGIITWSKQEFKLLDPAIDV